MNICIPDPLWHKLVLCFINEPHLSYISVRIWVEALIWFNSQLLKILPWFQNSLQTFTVHKTTNQIWPHLTGNRGNLGTHRTLNCWPTEPVSVITSFNRISKWTLPCRTWGEESGRWEVTNYSSHENFTPGLNEEVSSPRLIWGLWHKINM